MSLVRFLLDFKVDFHDALEDNKSFDQAQFVALLLQLFEERLTILCVFISNLLIRFLPINNTQVYVILSRFVCNSIFARKQRLEELELLVLLFDHFSDRLDLLAWQRLEIHLERVRNGLVWIVEPIFGIDEAALCQEFLEVELHVTVVGLARPRNQAHVVNHQTERQLFNAKLLKEFVFIAEAIVVGFLLLTEEEQILV
jgi:hypothetical protein